MIRYLAHLFISAATAIAAIALTVWLVDPMYLFRKPEHLPPRYYTAIERFQNIGIAKNFDYDTVIIGNSMSENFSTKQIEQELGWKAVNLSASGSSGYEQSRLLQYAISTGKVRRVIWLVQWYSFADPDYVPPDTAYLQGIIDNKPSYLFEYYLGNVQSLQWVAKLALGIGGETDMDRAWNWNGTATFGCRSVRNEYQKFTHPDPERLAKRHQKMPQNMAKMGASVEKNLLEPIRKNPAVHFYIVTAPHSVWSYKSIKNTSPESLSLIASFRKPLADFVEPSGNIDIYDFQSDADTIYDAALYKDMRHYSEQVNRRMVHAIAERRQMPVMDWHDFLEAIDRPAGCVGD